MTAIRTTDPLRVCLVANSRFPIGEPFTGGLESMTWHLTRELVPPRKRHATKPTRASKERRLDTKARTQKNKRLRGRIRFDD